MKSGRAALSMLLALGVLLAPLTGEAQLVKVPRVGILAPGSDRAAPLFDAFRQGLRELGYVEGQNFVLEIRLAEGRPERFPDLAAELVRSKVDIMVVWSTPGVMAAKRATVAIPIVMASSGDAVGTGLVADLARPGGNVTGLSWHHTEVAPKWVEIIVEAIPRASRIGVLWNSTNPPDRIARAALEDAGRIKKRQIDLVEARSGFELWQAFESLTRKKVEAVIILPNAVNGAYRHEIVELALNTRLPAMYGGTEYVKAGGLMAYSVDWVSMSRRAANYVDRILKGAKPADLPIEQPTKYELVINLKTANALGLTIPPSLLLRADQVIE